LLSAVAVSTASAADQQMNTQQQRMATCNADAKTKNLTGDARKAFMSDCLSGKTTAAAPATQQEKMKSCNMQASTQKLSGDARKQFMSTCLKG
jgi:hypothetical protein